MTINSRCDPKNGSKAEAGNENGVLTQLTRLPAKDDEIDGLRREHAQLKAAVSNMSQGMILFDTNHDIVFCNERYLEMFSLSRDVVKPGCSLIALLEHRKERGHLGGDMAQYCRSLVDMNKRGTTVARDIRTPEGRTIRMVNTPLAEGGGVVTFEDVSDQKQAEARIEHMAHHDALTDLPNRLLFQTRLEQALRWTRRGQQVAVLLIDLDNFKSINDTLGHQVGDELLKVIADRLRKCVRETDAVARLGGDEFVVVQTDVQNAAEAAKLAMRIRKAVMLPCKIGDHRIIIDTSIGIAISPADGTVPVQLIRSADMALYGAKGSGRGTYHFFEREMDARMAARHEMELDLRRALVRGEFELHYQPLLNLKRGEISCCEALLRWHHPDHGLIDPSQFIPIAEETGLIARIGEWVIRTACKAAATWPDHVTLAVNVSPLQFRSQDLVKLITHALATSNLSAERLEIEITEAILLEQTQATLEKLARLHALGVKIAMDDFGTGYSSLAYLQKFPFDKIKIDASFVKGLTERAESIAIVQAIVGLAHSFQMATTAEGVETEEQLRIVRELGCKEMQGHLLSRALPLGELVEFFSSFHGLVRANTR